MKWIFCLSIILITACNNEAAQENSNSQSDTPETTIDSAAQTTVNSNDTLTQPKTYSNTRFRNVTVTTSGKNAFLVKGEGQIFEANFGWVVEDGHNELKKGFQMTDAGAPEWGKFQFTVEVQKQQPHSTLHLILFEESAKDGSRQFQLPIPLPAE